MARALVTFLCMLGCSIFPSGAVSAFPGGAQPGVSGGFGEQSCTSCHNSFELNAGRAGELGDIVLSGLPKVYEPGTSYTVKVAVSHVEGRGAWGFQLAVRTSGGQQAGALKPIDERTQVLTLAAVEYIGHTARGHMEPEFEMSWTAPPEPIGDIVVNVAANAADGDTSPAGDYIYTTSVTIAPVSR